MLFQKMHSENKWKEKNILEEFLFSAVSNIRGTRQKEKNLTKLQSTKKKINNKTKKKKLFLLTTYSQIFGLYCCSIMI